MLTKRAEAPLDPTAPDAPFPYACQLDEKLHRLYVSLWAQACVAVVDLKSLQVAARWATQEHPNEMALTRSGRFLFVANANRNTVTVLDTATGRAAETLEPRFLPPPCPAPRPTASRFRPTTPSSSSPTPATTTSPSLMSASAAIPARSALFRSAGIPLLCASPRTAATSWSPTARA